MFEKTNWKNATAELLGTFFLIFFGVNEFINQPISTENNPLSDSYILLSVLKGLITLALTLMVLVHILGPISGCHLNPVITIPTMMSGQMNRDDGIAYMVAQIIGAILGFTLFNQINSLDGTKEVSILIFAMIGTTFFVTSLLTSQDPSSIGATLFIVASTAFGNVNPVIDIGRMVIGDSELAFFGIVGSLLGCMWGWLIKENIIDR
jgi:glycerol uptake facilitator-like aquaporin